MRRKLPIGDGIILSDGVEKVSVEVVGDFKLADLETAGDGTVAAGMGGIAWVVDKNKRQRVGAFSEGGNLAISTNGERSACHA